MLKVFLDESYNHPTAKKPHDPLLYTVGCWVSTVEKWGSFDKKWNVALRSAELDWFHMSEYESRLHDYEHWTNVKRINFLQRLHRIIKDHTMYGVTISVNCADYDKVVVGELQRAFGTTYYSFAVRMIMKDLAEWADKRNYQGRIEYLFAELKGQGNELDRIFREALKDEEMKKWLRLDGNWKKGIMRDLSQLQAADIIAYEMNKRAVNHASADNKFIRQSLNNLANGLFGKRLAPLYFAEDNLNLLLREARKQGLKM